MIFLDTGYFKGILDSKDNHHKEALKIEDYLKNSNETTVINTTVLVETLNWFVGTNNDVEELFNDLKRKNRLICLTNEDYLNSLELNRWLNNSLNYSDCTIFNTMVDWGIRKIVSFDEGFRNIGSLHVIYDM